MISVRGNYQNRQKTGDFVRKSVIMKDKNWRNKFSFSLGNGPISPNQTKKLVLQGFYWLCHFRFGVQYWPKLDLDQIPSLWSPEPVLESHGQRPGGTVLSSNWTGKFIDSSGALDHD